MTIIVTDEDVQRLLSMRECIEAMRTAFRDFAAASGILYRKAMAESFEQDHSDRMAGQRFVGLLFGLL